VLATPLQMAVAYAALVNGGQVFSPKVAKAVVTPEGTLVKAIKPQVQRTLSVSQTNLTDIKNAMYDVVTTGTAKGTFANFPLNKLLVGGKTGTAQVLDAKTKQITDTSVFASFAGLPGQDPQYVSVIMVPKGGYGADVAGPATRELWDGLYGLEGKTNVLPKGLRADLPNFSKDGNIVTKAPLIIKATPTVSPSGSATPTVGAGGTPATTGPYAPTTSGAAPTTTAKALGPLQSSPGSDPPARVVAFGASGRAPPLGPGLW
jgi:membrane peptidoglycan carboxypeptidase